MLLGILLQNKFKHLPINTLDLVRKYLTDTKLVSKRHVLFFYLMKLIDNLQLNF